ncbi:MAG: hypothetical protein CEE38_11310 [Planctomycetes bacterium B3_Pla]|nr:MAG: hypothetical protein CEE38_11310 [Planctomycetes bacterium B3_Pla]
MNRNQVLICVDFIFQLVGMVLAVRVLGWFAPVLDGDSMLPDGISVFLSLSVWDYLQACLCAVVLISGLYMLVMGAARSYKENTREDTRD